MTIGREAKLLIVFFLLCGAAAVLLSLGAGDRSTQSFLAWRSSYRSTPDGVRAFYLTLRRLGFPTHRWRRALVEGTMPKTGVMVIMQPMVPIAETEWRALADWVYHGNALLISAEPGSSLAAAFNAGLNWEKDGTGFAHPSEPSFLARGVKRIAVDNSLRLAMDEGIGEDSVGPG